MKHFKKNTLSLVLLTFLFTGIGLTKFPYRALGEENYISREIRVGRDIYEISVPSNWFVKEMCNFNSWYEIKFMKDGKLIGEITFQNDLPNHKEVLEQEKVSSPMGNGILYVLKRESDAAQQEKMEWLELVAQLNCDAMEKPNYIWMNSSKENIERDKAILNHIVGSLMKKRT